MTKNQYGINVNKIERGDRVEVRGAGADTLEWHWGTAAAGRGGAGFYVSMDDPNLLRADYYRDREDNASYYTWDTEVRQHIPAAKVAMHEGRPVNVEDHGQPTVFAAVVSQLHETISYLEQMTGKKFEPTVHSFGLSAEGTYTDNNVTIRFIETKEH